MNRDKETVELRDTAAVLLGYHHLKAVISTTSCNDSSDDKKTVWHLWQKISNETKAVSVIIFLLSNEKDADQGATNLYHSKG